MQIPVGLGEEEPSRVKAGRAYPIKYRSYTGRHQLTLELSAKLGDDESRISFPLEVAVVSPLSVRVTCVGRIRGRVG